MNRFNRQTSDEYFVFVGGHMRRDNQNSSSNEETFYTGENTPYRSNSANIENIDTNAEVNEYVKRATNVSYQLLIPNCFDKFAIDRHSIQFQEL